MQYQNSNPSGAKWLFFLAVVVLAGFLMLGTDLSKATWMNGDIAKAIATQISSQTLIEQQQASQELQTQAASDAESLAFQKTIHATVTAGLWVLAIAFSLGLFTVSIFGGIGLSRYLTAQAQAKQDRQLSGELLIKIEQLTRQLHASQELSGKSHVKIEQLIREVYAKQEQNRTLKEQYHALQERVAEMEQRENHRVTRSDIRNSVPIWPGNSEDLAPSKPSSWAK